MSLICFPLSRVWKKWKHSSSSFCHPPIRRVSSRTFFALFLPAPTLALFFSERQTSVFSGKMPISREESHHFPLAAKNAPAKEISWTPLDSSPVSGTIAKSMGWWALPQAVRVFTFLPENSHEKVSVPFECCAVVICAGVCCVVLAFVSNLVGVVYAQNNMTVRPNSPCKTNRSVCGVPGMPTQGCTSRTEEVVEPSNFQCDQPKSGTTCTGSGVWVLCYTVRGCYLVGENCVINPSSGYQPHTGETLKEVPMAG